MKNLKLFAVPLLVVAVLILLAVSSANGDGPYTQLPTITIPGNLGSFDISWVDPVAGRYYVADRTTASVDVVDTQNLKYLYSIKGFVGLGPSGKAGPNGILTWGNELWAGDGDSTVKVVDLTQGAAAVPSAIINTGGSFRADELAYDPLDHVILIANDRDSPPFFTFISQQSRTILSKLSAPFANGGIEQPVWNPLNRKFYVAVPANTRNPGGEIDELDPRTYSITKIFRTPCSPAGLALLPGNRLVTSCGTVVDATSGAVRGNITNPDGTNVSGDEIWYNPGDDRIYFGSNFVAVVDASTYALIDASGTAIFQALPSARFSVAPYQVLAYLFGFPVTPGGVGGHTLAADSATNRIFVPSVNQGVKVFQAN